MNGEQRAWLVFGIVLVIAICIFFTTLTVTSAQRNILRDSARIEHGIREGLQGSCVVIVMDDGVDMQCHFDTDKYDN